MKRKYFFPVLFFMVVIVLTTAIAQAQKPQAKAALKRYLYVAAPGIRDYLGFGGHGILVLTWITITGL